jgi:hypothetical protein
MSGAPDSNSLKYIILTNFDQVNYTIGACQYVQDQKENQCFYGYILTDITADRIGDNKGFDNKQGDAFSGDVYNVAIIGDNPTKVRNLLSALVKISDAFKGNSIYDHLYIDNLNNVIWDNWNENMSHPAHRRKLDVVARLSRNSKVNYTI